MVIFRSIFLLCFVVIVSLASMYANACFVSNKNNKNCKIAPSCISLLSFPWDSMHMYCSLMYYLVFYALYSVHCVLFIVFYALY